MLRSLHVTNLAIVQDIRIGFKSGLNVITGETGAGKSIAVGALGLIIGERAEKTMIRAGEEMCAVEAVFELADPASVDTILEELGMDTCVVKTRCPVRDARMAISAVSRSRVSPTRTMSGSCLRMCLSPPEKVRPILGLTCIWPMP